jgi:hypothetical protein
VGVIPRTPFNRGREKGGEVKGKGGQGEEGQEMKAIYRTGRREGMG